MKLKKVWTLMEVGLFQLLSKISSAFDVEKLLLKKIFKKNDSFSAWILANLYVDESKFVEAKEILELIMSEGKNNKNFIFLQSRIFYHLNEYNDVIKLLSNGAFLQEADGENYYLGISYLEKKDYCLAVKYLSRYIDHFRPKDFMPYLKIGLAYFRINDYENAKANFSLAKSLGCPTKQADELILQASSSGDARGSVGVGGVKGENR